MIGVASAATKTWTLCAQPWGLTGEDPLHATEATIARIMGTRTNEKRILDLDVSE
jgi:hypothetical protein